jgi:hypothetical protein
VLAAADMGCTSVLDSHIMLFSFIYVLYLAILGCSGNTYFKILFDKGCDRDFTYSLNLAYLSWN